MDNTDERVSAGEEKLRTVTQNQMRRLAFIDFRLAWTGFVNRALLQAEFQISPQQATIDLRAYSEAAPQNIIYSVRKKRYEAGEGFESLYKSTAASRYLRRAASYGRGSQRQENWIGPDIAVAVASTRTRLPADEILRSIVRAINESQSVEMAYVSMTSGRTSNRRIEPHALGFDGLRWHVRAYDHRRGGFYDFVLTRISDLVGFEPATKDSSDDLEWNSLCVISLTPSSVLTNEQSSAIAAEYEMTDGILNLHTTQAMLFYVLRSYGFDPRPSEPGEPMRNHSSLNLEILNLDEVEVLLGRR